MQAGTVLRVARPTDHLTTIAEMYATGLGFTVLAQFDDHDGFDGVILGHPQQPYHLEFTTQRGHHVGRAPTLDPAALLMVEVPMASVVFPSIPQ
jgi:YycE-like N-terminal domain